MFEALLTTKLYIDNSCHSILFIFFWRWSLIKIERVKAMTNNIVFGQEMEDTFVNPWIWFVLGFLIFQVISHPIFISGQWCHHIHHNHYRLSPLFQNSQHWGEKLALKHSSKSLFFIFSDLLSWSVAVPIIFNLLHWFHLLFLSMWFSTTLSNIRTIHLYKHFFSRTSQGIDEDFLGFNVVGSLML